MEKKSETKTRIYNDRVDKSLNKYHGKVLFPEKLEKANKFLNEHPIPDEILDLVRKKEEKKIIPFFSIDC